MRNTINFLLYLSLIKDEYFFGVHDAGFSALKLTISS
jgi:hypothetical protein